MTLQHWYFRFAYRWFRTVLTAFWLLTIILTALITAWCTRA